MRWSRWALVLPLKKFKKDRVEIFSSALKWDGVPGCRHFHCHWEMHQRSRDEALDTPDYVSVFFRLALWEGSVGMERSIGMLIFRAICYSEEAARDPPPPPLFSPLLHKSLAPIAYRKLVWDHHTTWVTFKHLLHSSRWICRSAQLALSLSFVGYKVALRFYFLTGSLILGSQLGNPAAIFESGNIAEGVMGAVMLFMLIFHWAPSFLCHSLVYRQAANRFCSYFIQASSSTFCKLQLSETIK